MRESPPFSDPLSGNDSAQSLVADVAAEAPTRPGGAVVVLAGDRATHLLLAEAVAGARPEAPVLPVDDYDLAVWHARVADAVAVVVSLGLSGRGWWHRIGGMCRDFGDRPLLISVDSRQGRVLRLIRSFHPLGVCLESKEAEACRIEAVRRVAARRAYLSPGISGALHDRSTTWPETILSGTEEVVLSFTAVHGDPRVASLLGMTIGTLRKHRGNIARRFDTERSLGLLPVALAHGYVRARLAGVIIPGLYLAAHHPRLHAAATRP